MKHIIWVEEGAGGHVVIDLHQAVGVPDEALLSVVVPFEAAVVLLFLGDLYVAVQDLGLIGTALAKVFRHTKFGETYDIAPVIVPPLAEP